MLRRILVVLIGVGLIGIVKPEAILNSMAGYSSGADAILPRFLTESKRFRVVLGETIILPCEIQNLGTFVVIWRRGNSILSAGRLLVTRDTRFSLQGGGAQHALQLSGARLDDQGEYTCQIGDGGAGDLIHHLEILSNSILSAGRLLVTRDTRFSLQGGGAQHALQLSGARLDDQGEYTCQIGDGGAGDLIHHLEILIPPTLQVSPPTGQITARRGGSVSFECKATGNPVPAIHWTKKDGTLPSGLQVESGYLLTWADVQRQHAGTYTCTASNGIGQPVSAEIHLHVLYPPEVNVLRSWVNAGEGLEAKLDCIVHADPPAEVLWYQDSFALQPTDRRIMSSSGKKHSLTIKNIQLADFGNYSCVVVNSIGKDKRYIELSGKPGPAIVISTGYSGPHEYTLKWTVQSVFPIAEVRILYRRLLFNASYQHAGKWHDLVIRPVQIHFTAPTNERSYHYRLVELSPDSVYECMVQCRNQNGWGELSDTHQWFTKHRGAPDHAVYAAGAHRTRRGCVGLLVALVLARGLL